MMHHISWNAQVSCSIVSWWWQYAVTNKTQGNNPKATPWHPKLMWQWSRKWGGRKQEVVALRPLKTKGQSLTIGFGHSKAGVIRPCTERQRQSLGVNIQDLLKYQVTFSDIIHNIMQNYYRICSYVVLHYAVCIFNYYWHKLSSVLKGHRRIYGANK